jgi:8-oxo-dGTP pyrophosphatase MutT (NUDIX family)
MITSADRRLPEDLAARARTYAEGGTGPVSPRDAATIALLREAADAPGGVEVYVLRRVSTMAFASGMHVFPGGTVDPRDLEHEIDWVGPPPSVWARRFGVDEVRARGLVLAAVRETFEESGVLLAGRRHAAGGPPGVVADTTADGWEADRLALINRTLSFAAMLERRELVVRADLLRAWARWLTPEFEPRRYDTAFLVAAVPAGQRTREVGGEADRVAWVRPQHALDALATGDVLMLPPTAAVLGELARFDSVAAVLDAAGDRTITTIMPRPVLDDGDPHVVLPGEPGYDR